jgi:ATP-dependent phosphofructokinase / diphosphate-dependent phosphofructokinase
MRVGVLTGGGDCPGLNAVIRAVVRKGEVHYGDEIIGFYDAWDGVLEHRYLQLDVRSLRGMLPRGGTLLGTRRGSPFDHPHGVERVKETFAELALDGLVVIGGNGSLTVASKLHTEAGLPIVGVPKTIDNDIVGTDVTFGFHTAVQIATDAIDRLHTTAESHDRVMVVEVMGRDSGWIATYAGIAGGATVILVPERPFDLDEVAATIQRRHERGRYASIVVVAEGAEPVPGSIDVPDRGYDSSGHKRSPRRSRSASASRPGSCRSVTSNAAGRRAPTTGCSRPATAWRPSTPSTTRRGATWWCCVPPRSNGRP